MSIAIHTPVPSILRSSQKEGADSIHWAPTRFHLAGGFGNPSERRSEQGLSVLARNANCLVGTISIPHVVCNLTHLGRHGNRGSVSAYATSLEAPACKSARCSRWLSQRCCTEDKVTENQGHLKVRFERRRVPLHREM